MKVCLYIAGFFFLNSLSFAQQNEDPEPHVAIEFDEREEESKAGTNRIFRNPALASGLGGGADQLNKSFNSLMESVFYGLLDNELVYDVTDSSQFTTSLKRDVYSASDGSYVLVDRFSIGPKYLAPLTTIQNVPLNIGGEGAVNILHIYRRSDGMRLAESKELPFYRVLMNNWFGILPLLTNILPPSFNPNELYDPVTQLGTPFIFPFTPKDIQEMPIGSIRSYSISGGIQLSIDAGDSRSQSVKDALTGIDDVVLQLPYTIYKKGEHRISVLRRSKDLVWVGLTDAHRVGHGLRNVVGHVGRIFAKVSPYWSGVPALFFPVDLEGNIYDLLKYDQLYEFNMTNREAQVAFSKAVQGNFSLSQKYAVKGNKTGVKFHYKKKESGVETEIGNSRNLFIHRDTRKLQKQDLEVETIDSKGRLYTLEARAQTEDENWNALVGDEQINFGAKTVLKVGKTKNAKHPYAFLKGVSDPTTIMFSLNINDRFTDVLDFRRFLSLLRLYTQLPLASIPTIPLRVEEDLVETRRTKSLINPVDDTHDFHVTPTYLGKLTANASVYFSYEQIRRVVSATDSQKWSAFAKAYGLDPNDWSTVAKRERFLNRLNWVSATLAYPLRLFNIRILYADAIREMTNGVNALNALNNVNDTPVELVDKFYELLESDHPAHLVAALLYLGDLKKIPRSVAFTTSKKGDDRGQAKKIFKGLDGTLFESEVKFPPAERSDEIQEKESMFIPSNLTETRDRPKISHILVATEKVDELIENKHILVNHITIQLKAKDLPPAKKAKILVRVEQSGKLDLGRLMLAEGVLNIASSNKQPKKDEFSIYKFFLTGPKSELDGFLLRKALELGTQFDVSFSLSGDGEVWSTEKKVSFRFEDGKLLPPP
ncbi:MAG: hypothetical protein AB7T49_01025 [Oligoflexales bacterium]